MYTLQTYTIVNVVSAVCTSLCLSQNGYGCATKSGQGVSDLRVEVGRASAAESRRSGLPKYYCCYSYHYDSGRGREKLKLHHHAPPNTPHWRTIFRLLFRSSDHRPAGAAQLLGRVMGNSELQVTSTKVTKELNP